MENSPLKRIRKISFKEPNIQDRFKYFAQTTWLFAMTVLLVLGWHSGEDTMKNIKNAMIGALLF